MAEKACVMRLQKEYRAICKYWCVAQYYTECLTRFCIVLNFWQFGFGLIKPADDTMTDERNLLDLPFKEPVSHVVARPSPNDILEWHYVLEGSQGTPFAGGYYYGKIKFPPHYPFKPPGISMTTPNGRFMTQKKLCLSMSDFHPESWNPMWSVSSILTGLLSFMMDTSPTTGSVNTTEDEKKRLAKESLAFNCKNATFRKMFPEYVEKYEKQRLAEEVVVEEQQQQQVSGVVRQAEALVEKREEAKTKRVEKPKEEVKEGRKQLLPTWMVLLLVSFVGLVMALPLLQL